ncbi:hypothetical protein BKA70DRAFT_1254100 [Coprinopsis sp. MPI-PUGE-AT-0042]|nr:hypothetical protein BKA70DRAFT_1254100 [Coprinopsis sp. MPI-PUGE-AT-0042]
MGFFKRLLSIGKKDKQKLKKFSQQPETLQEEVEEEEEQPSRVAEGEEDHEETIGRLLRSSSQRYNVVQEVDYANMPPMPHPINNIVSQSSPYLTPQYTAATSTVSLHSTLGTSSSRYNVTVHRHPTPDRQPSNESVMASSKASRTPKARTTTTTSNNDDNDHLNPNNDSRVLRLRSDPSVASLMSLYDDHGRLSEAAFSNSPEKKPTATKPVKEERRKVANNDDSEDEGELEKVGRAQCKRSGSTLRQLLGVPANAGSNSEGVSDEEGDISWAERFLAVFCSIISNITVDNPAISSMDVELSVSSTSPSALGDGDDDTKSILREFNLADKSFIENGGNSAPGSKPSTPYGTPYKGSVKNSPYRNPDPSTPQRASQVFDFITKKSKQSKPPLEDEKDKELPLPPPSSFHRSSSSSDGRHTPSSNGTTPRSRATITPSRISLPSPMDLSRSRSTTPGSLSRSTSTALSLSRSTSTMHIGATTPHHAPPSRTSSSRRPMSELVDSFTRNYGNQEETKTEERPATTTTAFAEPTIPEDEQLEVAPLTIEELTRSTPEEEEEQKAGDNLGNLPPSAFQTPLPSSKQRPVKVLMSGPTKVIVTAPTPGSAHPGTGNRIPRGPRSLSKPSGSRHGERRRKTSGGNDGGDLTTSRRTSSGEKRRSSGEGSSSKVRMSTPAEVVSGTMYSSIPHPKDAGGRESKRRSGSIPMLVNDENDPSSLLGVQSAGFYQKERRDKERAERAKEKARSKDKERSSKDKEKSRKTLKGSTKSLIAFKYDDAPSAPTSRDIRDMKELISMPYRQRPSKDNLRLSTSSHTKDGSLSSHKGSLSSSTGRHLGVRNEIPLTPLRSQDRNAPSSSRVVDIPGFGFDPSIASTLTAEALSPGHHPRSRSSQERSSTKLTKPSKSQRESFDALSSSHRRDRDGGSYSKGTSSGIHPPTPLPPRTSLEPTRDSRRSTSRSPSPLGIGDLLKPRPSQHQKKRSGLFNGFKSASTLALGRF